MNYPTKTVFNGWIEQEVEMTSAEYEKCVNNYRNKINKLLSSNSRVDNEYGCYLKKWFSEDVCDGFPFSMKYKLHKLPMSMNVYFG